jgi:hypothetical protein
LQRSGKGELPSVPANCCRNNLIGALRDKNISGADTASLICGSCQRREPCTNATGPGYGYLNQRHSALSSPLLRAHPDSLPDPHEYDYSEIIAIWDEPGQNFRVKRQVQVTLVDLQQSISQLLNHPQLFAELQLLLTALLSLSDGSINLGKFGKNFAELRSLLPDVSHLDIEAIFQALVPNLRFLNTTEDYGVDLADLPRELRKRFTDRDSQMAEQAREQVLKQWLPELVAILKGWSGSIHVDRKGLTLTFPDLRYRAVARAARGNVFLDGTLTREDLALKLGCSPAEIKVVRQATPSVDNLEVVQVTDMGRMGMFRGADQDKRAAAISSHYHQLDPTTQIIDFKKFAADGAWWRDSRGVNDFLETQTLILMGTPCRNLTDLASEYAVLTGRYPAGDDVGFKAFVDRTIQAEICQAIGRLRAHRRPDEQLRVVLITDLDLTDFGVSIQQVKGYEICIAAGKKTDRVRLAIEGAIRELISAGKQVGQEIVAGITGIPRGTVARYWRLFISLVDQTNSKMNKPRGSPGEVEKAAATAMEEMAQLPTTEFLPNLGEVFFDWLNPQQWGSVWEMLDAQTQIAVLKALTLTIPEVSLQALSG